jgi:hypothetical protein
METVFENKLINSYKAQTISFLKSHPEYFNEALELAISEKQPYAWRSAYVLWDCIEENDSRLKAHIKSIVKSLATKKDGHKRELLKILFKIDIEEKYEGIIFDECVRLWEQISKEPSVRMIALRFIIKIVKKHPELLEEVNILVQDQYLEPLSPAVRKSIMKMMEEVTLEKKKYRKL